MIRRIFVMSAVAAIFPHLPSAPCLAGGGIDFPGAHGWDSPVVISEVFPNPLTGWIELQNRGADAVDLSDWKIRIPSNGIVLPDAGKPAALGSVLRAGGFRVIGPGGGFPRVDSENGRVELWDSGGLRDSVSWGGAGGVPPIAPAGFSLARTPAGSFALTPYLTRGSANRFPLFDVRIGAPADGEELPRGCVEATWGFLIRQIAPSGEPQPNCRVACTVTLRGGPGAEVQRFFAGTGAHTDAWSQRIGDIGPGTYVLGVRAVNGLGQVASDEVEVLVPEQFFHDRWLAPKGVFVRTLYEGFVEYGSSPAGWRYRRDGRVFGECTAEFFPSIDAPRGWYETHMIDSMGCGTGRTYDDGEIWERVVAVWDWLREVGVGEGEDGCPSRDWPAAERPSPSLHQMAVYFCRYGRVHLGVGGCNWKAQRLTTLLHAVGVPPERLAMARAWTSEESGRRHDNPVAGGRHYYTIVRVYGSWLFLDPTCNRSEELSIEHPSSMWPAGGTDYAHPEAIYPLPGTVRADVPLVEWGSPAFPD